MKKILSLVLALAITLSLVSTASAVEIINNQTTTTSEGTWELCSWLTDSNGFVCAQKYGETDKVLAVNESTNKLAGIVGNGKIQRSHARHYVTLDEINWVDQGDGEALWCRVEFVELTDPEEQAKFDAFGITTCEELEDALTEATVIETDDGEKIIIAYYRGVEIDLEKTKANVDVVAKVYVGKQYFHVLLIDYDGDGDRELCLHFGLLSSGKSSGGNNDNKDDNDGTDDEGTDDEGTDDEGTDDEGTKPGNNDNKKPDPENDEVVLPWEPSGSSNNSTPNNTSTGSKTPDPGNDDVKLPF